eukprot:gene18094-19901_t
MQYFTCKYVVLRDWKLGLSYYFVIILILIFMISQFVVEKAYLEFDTSPSGHVRIIANSPPLKETEQHLKLNHKYCCTTISKNISSLKTGCRNCRTLDGLALNWPVESRAVNLATFIIERWEETGHMENKEDFSIVRSDKYFTLHPEHVLLKIEHSIAALAHSDNDASFTASRKMMKGKIVDKDGALIRRFEGKGKPDGIRLIELLRAAGVKSLDSQSDACNARNRTYRENGVVLHVTIKYENADGTFFGTSEPEYTYSVRRIKFSEYKVKQEIPALDPDSFTKFDLPEQKRRKVLKRFCIRLEFSQTGKIGKFSLSRLLTSLATGFGLFGYSVLIIDVYALYLSPDRGRYREHVYEYSKDLRGKAQLHDSGVNDADIAVFDNNRATNHDKNIASQKIIEDEKKKDI